LGKKRRQDAPGLVFLSLGRSTYTKVY